jgi:hypothetical protein
MSKTFSAGLSAAVVFLFRCFEYERFDYKSFKCDSFQFGSITPDSFEYEKFGITIIRRE